jgi:uncharacterized membrane protein
MREKTMNLSGVKSKAYLIIISAFAIGVITGALVMNLVVTRSLATKKPLTPIEELTTFLQLDSEQRVQIEQITRDSKQKSKECFKTIQPQLDEVRTQARLKIKALLRPEQQVLYDEWNHKRDAQKSQERSK